MKLIIEEIAQFLDNHGFGTYKPDEIGGNIFINILPPTPDELIYLRPTIGLDSDPRLKTDVLGVQIIYRGTENLETFRKAIAVYNALNEYMDQPFITGGLYVISCLGSNSGPYPIGRDGKSRYEYTMNFIIECERST